MQPTFPSTLLQKAAGILFTTVLFSIGAYAQSTDSSYVIDILQSEILPENPARHDLLVFKEDSTYKVTIFLDYNDTIRTHNAFLHIPGDFHKVKYTWVSKDRAAVTLFNPDTKREFRLEVWGNGPSSTGMQILD